MIIMNTKYGSERIALTGANDWWKKGKWRTERGSDAEVATLTVITVALRAGVPAKQVHYYSSDASS